jgi:hypothetical protein
VSCLKLIEYEGSTPPVLKPTIECVQIGEVEVVCDIVTGLFFFFFFFQSLADI